jgi:hypothetical protein
MEKSDDVDGSFTSIEFNRFLADLDNESDRGVVLSATCMVELQIERCLKAWLSKGPKDASDRLQRNDGPLGSLAARIDLLCCVGGIDEFELSALHLLRRLRNEFAHNLLADFKTQSISDRTKNFSSLVLASLNHEILKKLSEQGPRASFTAAVFVLVDMLNIRPALIYKMSDTLRYDFAEMNREIQALIDAGDDKTP